MKTIFKKFNVNANEDILQIPEVKQTIETAFGTNALSEKQSINMELTALMCDSDTQIEIRHFYNISTYLQDPMGGVIFCPETNIAQIISTNTTSGIIILSKEED